MMVFRQSNSIFTMAMCDSVAAGLRLILLKRGNGLLKQDFVVFLYIGELIESESKRELFEFED